MRETQCIATDSGPGRRLLDRIMQRPQSSSSDLDAPSPGKWILAASRLMIVFAVMAVASLFVGAGAGYQWARQYDGRLAVDQRTALREIISAFPSPLLGIDRFEPRVAELARRAAGLRNLKFETIPANVDRENFPLFDANGRIGGFLTWETPHPMVQMMGRLASISTAIGIVLSGFAALSLWQLARARRELARRDAEIVRAADEDKLTGLPNHTKVLELLDLALAERADGEWTTFALIEIDGMDDVVAQRLSISHGQGRRARGFQLATTTAWHAAPEDIVFATGVNADYRPHLMIVGHDCHARRPNHIQDCQII